jgi:hypothetical protein
MSKRIRYVTHVAFLVCAIATICCLQIGCGETATRTDDPAEVEKIRKEHQDMSKREMANEG